MQCSYGILQGKRNMYLKERGINYTSQIKYFTTSGGDEVVHFVVDLTWRKNLPCFLLISFDFLATENATEQQCAEQQEQSTWFQTLLLCLSELTWMDPPAWQLDIGKIKFNKVQHFLWFHCQQKYSKLWNLKSACHWDPAVQSPSVRFCQCGAGMLQCRMGPKLERKKC